LLMKKKQFEKIDKKIEIKFEEANYSSNFLSIFYQFFQIVIFFHQQFDEKKLRKSLSCGQALSKTFKQI